MHPELGKMQQYSIMPMEWNQAVMFPRNKTFAAN